MRQLIKRILPKFLLTQLKLFIQWGHLLLKSFFVNSPSLSRFYFSTFNSSFQREQFAVLQGMQAHKKRVVSESERSNPLLRRNIHRIEKGLIMRPRKAVFALEYIEETQQAYTLASKVNNYHQDELNWAKAVLTKFYQSIKLEQSSLLSNLAREFKEFNESNVDHATALENNRLIPYQSEELPMSDISYEQLAEFIQVRRSTRWFKQTRVCYEKIKKAVTIASQAPSACNRQPYEFYIIDKKPLLPQISKLAIGAGGFADNIPCLVVLVGDYSNYVHERDRHAIYIDASLASMQFMQALPTLGLASCPLNWPELSLMDKKLSMLLKLPSFKRTIMLIAVGEPEPRGGIPYSQKKTAEQLIHYVD